MGFTKLDQSIIQSSIMSEPPEVFKVWIVFLASAGPDGIARVSVQFLSAASRMDLDVVRNAIIRLESPDPDSRSLNDEGRRIKRVDGGWMIINYKKYREFKYSCDYEARRKRVYRNKAKTGTCPGHFGTVPGHSASASASESSYLRKERERERKKTKISFDHSAQEWRNIMPNDISAWHEAYPACDISLELAKMREWIKANPAKGHKSNWRAFITRWLSKSQDRGGGMGVGQKPPESLDDYYARMKAEVRKGAK